MPELSDKQLRARRPVKLHAMPPRQPAAVRALPALPDYAELHCLTNFSFQRGASRPEELVTQAYHLGYRALAITDECSVAGIVRAHVALRDHPQAMADHEHEHPEEPPNRPWKRERDARLDVHPADAPATREKRSGQGVGDLAQLSGLRIEVHDRAAGMLLGREGLGRRAHGWVAGAVAADTAVRCM